MIANGCSNSLHCLLKRTEIICILKYLIPPDVPPVHPPKGNIKRTIIEANSPQDAQSPSANPDVVTIETTLNTKYNGKSI